MATDVGERALGARSLRGREHGARVLVVAAVLAVLAAVAVARSAPALAISGGTPADDTASAFAVRIDIARTATTTWTCSGSLVAPELVLTAAHCLYSHDPAAWTLTFAAGSGTVERRGVRAVLPYSVDAGAGPVTSVDDLGLVQLDRPVTDRSPARLDRAGTLDRLAASGGPVVEIGYGGVHPAATPVARRAGQVLASTAPTLPAVGVQSLAPLVETGPPVPGAAVPVPAGSCEPGDSGGPLVAGDGISTAGIAATASGTSADPGGSVLLGVTSRGSDTGHCWFTRVDSASPYRTWLDDKITRFGGEQASALPISTAAPAPQPVATPAPETATVQPAEKATPIPAATPATLPATVAAAAPVTVAATAHVPTPAAAPVTAHAPARAAAPVPATSPVPVAAATPSAVADTALAAGLGGLAATVPGRLAVGAPVAPGGVTSTGTTGTPVPILAPVSASGTPPWTTGP